MIGFIEASALRMEGLTNEDIDGLNAVLPDIQNLLKVVDSHKAQFDRVFKVVMPIAQKIVAKQQEFK